MVPKAVPTQATSNEKLRLKMLFLFFSVDLLWLLSRGISTTSTIQWHKTGLTNLAGALPYGQLRQHTIVRKRKCCADSLLHVWYNKVKRDDRCKPLGRQALFRHGGWLQRGKNKADHLKVVAVTSAGKRELNVLSFKFHK